MLFLLLDFLFYIFLFAVFVFSLYTFFFQCFVWERGAVVTKHEEMKVVHKPVGEERDEAGTGS